MAAQWGTVVVRSERGGGVAIVGAVAINANCLRRGGQKKRLEMPVTVLPTVKKDQLLFMTLKFKQYRRCKIIEGLN
jgi:hypothetical protein